MDWVEERAGRALEAVPEYIWEPGKPPIPVEDIADHLGLRIREVEPEVMAALPGAPGLDVDQSLSGLLLRARKEIWVNADEHRRWPRRTRFTIAHELGHWHLHLDREKSLFCRAKNVQPDEQEEEALDVPDIEEEASVFAAALLMPPEMMRKYYDRFSGQSDLHGLMCKVFNCSGAAMGRRLHAVI
jgi:IrrE N-terminal-like domain